MPSKLKLNRKLTLTVLILGALLLVAIFSQFNRNLVFNNAPINDQGEYVIEFTKEGFNPNNIIINIGDTVRFVNLTDELFWPASNAHPHHEAYPEFDPKIPIDPDGSWAFTFDKPGRWTFHDHIFAYLGGSILVLDGENMSVEELSKCFEFKSIERYEKKGCFENFDINYVSLMSAEDAFKVIQRAYEVRPDLISGEIVQGSCHDHSHIIGDIAYQEYLRLGSIKDANWPEEAINICGGGFIHGFLEHYTKDTSNLETISDFCIELAQNYPERPYAVLNDCYHGVGHGFTLEPRYGSQEWGNAFAMAQPGVDKCREYIEASGEQPMNRCFSGVLNSVALWHNIGLYGLSAEQIKDEPFKLCRKLEDDVKEHCYLEDAGILSAEFGHDVNLVFEKYGRYFTDLEMEVALLKASVPAYVHEKDATEDELVSLCKGLPDRLVSACIDSAVNGYLSGGLDDEGYKGALSFCSNDTFNDQDKVSCYEKLFSRALTVYPRELTVSVCNEFEEDYKYICDFDDLPITGFKVEVNF